MLSDNKIEEIALNLLNGAEKASGLVKFVYNGNSMYPMLREGDILLVKYSEANTLAMGDLVAYRSKGAVIVHRFLYRKEISGKSFIVAKADNRWWTDKPFGYESLLGKVTELQKGSQRLILRGFLWRSAGWVIGSLSLIEGMVFENIQSLSRLSRMPRRLASALVKRMFRKRS